MINNVTTTKKIIIGDILKQKGVKESYVENAEIIKEDYNYPLPNHGIKIKATICTSLYYHYKKKFFSNIISALREYCRDVRKEYKGLKISYIEDNEYNVNFARLFPWQTCLDQEIFPMSYEKNEKKPIKIAVKTPFAGLEKEKKVPERLNLFRTILNDKNIDENSFEEIITPQFRIFELINSNLEISKLLFSMIRELFAQIERLDKVGGTKASLIQSEIDDKADTISKFLQRESMALGATKVCLTIIELVEKRLSNLNSFKMIGGLIQAIDLLRPPLVPLRILGKYIEENLEKDKHGRFRWSISNWLKIKKYCVDMRKRLEEQENKITMQLKSVISSKEEEYYVIYGYSYLIFSAFENIYGNSGNKPGIAIIRNKEHKINILTDHIMYKVANKNKWNVIDFDDAIKIIENKDNFVYKDSSGNDKLVPITKVRFLCVGACSLYNYGAFCELNIREVEEKISEMYMKDRRRSMEDRLKNPRPDFIVIAGDYKFLYDFILANKPLGKVPMQYHHFLPLRGMDAIYLG